MFWCNFHQRFCPNRGVKLVAIPGFHIALLDSHSIAARVVRITRGETKTHGVGRNTEGPNLFREPGLRSGSS
jgi:hypothetical protein